MLHNKPLGLYGAFKSESQDAPWRFGEKEREEVEVIGNGERGGAHEMDKGVGLCSNKPRRSVMQLTAWQPHHKCVHSHLLPGRSGRGRRRGLAPPPAPSERARSAARSRTPEAPY